MNIDSIVVDNSRNLTKMSLKRKRIEEELQPTVKLESDGDLLVKSLLEKQLSTESNLQTELHRKKEFVPSTEYKPISSYVSGINTLEDLKNTERYIQNLEEFKAAGLNDEDLKFYMNKKLGIDHLKMIHKNLDTESIELRFSEINKILNEYRMNKNAQTSHVSGRLQMECMLSTKPNSLETKLLKFALENEKQNNKIFEETGNLPDIEKDFMKSINDNSLMNINTTKLQKKVQRRLRAMSRKIDTISSPPIKSIFKPPVLTPTKNTMWDVKNIDSDRDKSNKKNEKQLEESQSEPNNLEISEQSIQTSENRYTIRNGTIINLKNVIDYKKCKKLSLEEIRDIPKFSNYSSGSPTKILYLRNIHSLSMKDLELLFNFFNFETKTINIMKGRMKGQAFIEMESCELARQALEHLNGIILKNKPIIIQFSTKTELPKN